MNDNSTTNSREKNETRRKRSGWRNRFAILAFLLSIIFALVYAMTPKQPGIDWSVADMPSQKERIFLVTGGNSGIGYECSRALAAAGAGVIIASRNAKRGQEAVDSIRQETPGANVRFEVLDLGDLTSVRALGKRLNETLPYLDGLINNAGVMEPPEPDKSKDGFELQFAVNYLGHFALTRELLPLLQKSSSPRVVTLGSIAASHGSIHFDDLQFEKEYQSFPAYAQSKLACVMFASELQKRSDAEGWGIQSFASHPGLSRTSLQDHRTGIRRMVRALFQSAEQGAVPTLYAATAPEAKSGTYYGPTGLMEARGPMGIAKVPASANDTEARTRLWTISEDLSSTSYP